MFIDYDESILSYVSCIRRYFGLSASFPLNEKFRKLLERQRPAKVFVLLIDGMGSRLIQKKLKEDSFLRRNLFMETQTVFPTTTTSATTAIRSGRAPNENAWLGWTQYLKEVDDIIIPFRSIGYYNDVEYEKGIFERCIPVTYLEDELPKNGIKARSLFPDFAEDGCADFEIMCERLADYSNDSPYSYIYAYWDSYDTYMHMYGPSAAFCDSYLLYLDERLEKLSRELSSDTLLVVTADHGQIDVGRTCNFYGSKYEKYFYRRPALESRAMAFYIRKGLEKEFSAEFKKEFADDFILLSQEEVIEGRLFGPHPSHARFQEFIGDFLAIAKSDLILVYSERPKKPFRGQHAGICDDEVMIPVVVFKNSDMIVEDHVSNL